MNASSSDKDNRRKIVIIIGGPPGSGKSTLAKKIAELFNLRYYSTGHFYRRMASERGIDPLELDKIAEKDPSIDHEVDALARSEAEKGDVVLDTHVGGWLLKDLSDLSIYVTASLETRARRVAERDKKSFEEALKEIISREQSMKKRFWEYYKVDINDLSVFDLVINTERIDIDLMIEISAIAVKNILLRR
ncbi:MAG: AAA family ATPase [Desulfurococcales archaeon]|jgi:cytidylate kinase|nr:AAA family ATPase [Desulfurococcales archaeon]